MEKREIQRLLRGEQTAWKGFVMRWRNLIYTVVLRTLQENGPAQEAEELCQEVFLRLIRDDFRLLRQYDPEKAGLATWLTLVARSTTLDHLRRQRPETVPLEQVPETGTPAPFPRAESLDIPEGVLSPRQRLVLKLLLEKGLSPQEAADFLQVEVQTIHSMKNKALQKLRKFFQNGGRFEAKSAYH
ncbi:sigma-70 family RNA polymerase sigma factor [Methylomarinovum caldicuralii]|nr:sigma-70 family RNA polymerase sigma factor [Methylomarinovum caldicuralii]